MSMGERGGLPRTLGTVCGSSLMVGIEERNELELGTYNEEEVVETLEEYEGGILDKEVRHLVELTFSELLLPLPRLLKPAEEMTVEL